MTRGGGLERHAPAGRSVLPADHGYRLIIGGEELDGAAVGEVIDPATGRPFATVPLADAQLLDRALAAARGALQTWGRQSWEERQAVLGRIAGALDVEVEALARLLTLEQGKPIAQARREILGSIATLRYFASLEPAATSGLGLGEREVAERLHPVGVVAAITPWNFPVALLMNKLAPALLAGNPVVVKPAPTTPLTTLALARIAAPWMPPGTLSTVVDANDLGPLLVADPRVAKVAFTGSTPTGRAVMRSAAATLKRLTLELGGNDAALVLADADVEATARQLLAGALYNAGQVCVAIKRIYVPDALYGDYAEALARLAQEMVVGPGLNEATQVGPVQNLAQYRKLRALLEDSRARGRVLCGGLPDTEGYFLRPAVVADLDDDAELVCQEQFGPLVPLLRYGSLEEGIRRANDTPYGLGASVWGRDAAQANAVAERLEAGTVWVNRHLVLAPHLPFRGIKQSGLGVELGRAGLDEYLERRLVHRQCLAEESQGVAAAHDAGPQS